MKYDFLIVGAGFFGATFARQATDLGYSCLILDKRTHVGGNCYTENNNGIHVHKYGPHIFHTNSDQVWKFINQWASFNSYVHRPKVNHKGNLYSFPINLFTLHQIWGVNTPEEAKNKLEEVRVPISNPQNLEEWIISRVGVELYEIFIYGYTKKQWNKEPKELPSSIIKRLPIRLTHDDNYFNDKYQGIPIGGYTEIFNKMLDGIQTELNVDYLMARDYWDNKANKIVYTGAIDEFFNNTYGTLEWRSLTFKEEFIENCDHQGNAIINYTEENIPFTRIVEHKHFDYNNQQDTIITKEYPGRWSPGQEKFYPINKKKNNELYLKYKKLINTSKYIFGGRLADYKYYDMNQIIAAAFHHFSKIVLTKGC
jgi:UDP-galactopyranose mutase